MDGRVVYESVGSVCGECVGVDEVCVGLRVWECVMWNMHVCVCVCVCGCDTPYAHMLQRMHVY